MSIEFGTERPELDARLEGIGPVTVSANSTDTSYIELTGECIFNGIAIYSTTDKIGDYVSCAIEYYRESTSQWLRYKKLSKSWMIFPSVYEKVILFPARGSEGVRIAISYTNTGDADVIFGANLFKYVDSVLVSTSTGQQGEDW